MNARGKIEDLPATIARGGIALAQLGELSGFVASSPEDELGVVEGVSLVVLSQTDAGGVRIVPIEAVTDFSRDQRTISLEPPIEPRRIPRLRSLRRLGNKWRVDLALDAAPMNADYWLAHCHGFLVNAPVVDVGVVDDVILDAYGHAEALLVRAGGFRGRDLLLAVDDIVEIVPEDKLIGVRTLPDTRKPKAGRAGALVSHACPWFRPHD
jgi:hypothetical protein